MNHMNHQSANRRRYNDMELQAVLVRWRIDELEGTARELRAVDSSDGQVRIGLRRQLGERLIALGIALIGSAPTGRRSTSAQMS